MRILVLTHRLPYAPNRGDRIRAFHLLKLLAAHHEVHLVSLVHDEAERAQVPEMQQWLASVRGAMVPHRLQSVASAALALPGRRPLTHVLLDSPDRPEMVNECVAAAQPDVVLAYCTGMVRYAFAPPLADVPCVLDMVDVDSQKWADLATTTAPPMGWVYAREARLLRAFEKRAMAQARATTVVSERERELAERVLGGPPPLVVPNGVDVHWFARPHAAQDSAEVVFCGVFNYGPNVEGAVWLVDQVWPLVRRELPAAVLRLVGMQPSERVRKLAAAGSVDVTGAVDDVRPYLWRAAVGVAPLKVARGLQNKVLEAVAAGLPVVVTPAVYDGLPVDVRPAVDCRTDPAAFASAIVSLIRAGAAERSARLQPVSLDGYSWRRRLAPFLDVVEQVRLGRGGASH